MPKKIVLIVEDDRASSEALAYALNRFDVEIRRAYTLESAKRQLQNPNEFYLITWDYVLPDGTTEDLIKATRAKFGDRPMIAASSQKATRRIQMQVGCSHELEIPQIHQLFKTLLT